MSEQVYRIEHDGFEGIQIGTYTTLEGKKASYCNRSALASCMSMAGSG